VERYATRIDDGTLHVASPDGWLTIGAMAEVIDLVGGETYTVEYPAEARVLDWIDAPDGTFEFDVRDVLSGMSYEEQVVAQLAEAPLDETTDEGYPRRTVLFADLMTRIWDSRGHPHQSEEERPAGE